MASPDPARQRHVAVLVHNDVLKDARVLKEVETLGAAGYVVDVIGASPKPGTYPATVPGARSLTIVDIAPKSLQGRFYSLADKIYPLVLDYAILLVAVLPVFFLLALPQTPQGFARALVLVSPFVLLGIRSLKTNSSDRKRIARLAMAVFALTLIIVGGYGIVSGAIGLVLFMLVFSALFAVQRLELNLRRVLFRVVNGLRDRRLSSHRKERYHAIARALADRVDPTRHEIVHCHDIIALIAGTRLKKRHSKLFLIWDAHEFYEEVASGTEEDRLLMREVIGDAQGYVDGFVTISESFRDIYARDYPRLPPAQVVMNATRNAGAVEDDGRLHRAAGLSPDRKILLFQGGFSPHRGIGHLIEAAADLPQPWSIVMMGWGKLEPEISAAIDQLTDPDHPEKAPLAMIPAAPQDELPYWSAGAALGAIPYENVGMNHLYCTPNKLWEFPNAGVPILATGLVEMERIISEWGTGFLLPRDFGADDILKQLEVITPADLDQARANCRRFSDAMSWDRFEDALLRAYPA
ncbi:glycosyltransferase family 4 protein [Paracoccus zhejiangensis]|uniref:Glycosyltransferase n=1 Tax=Paracoccus zhejiangensis TaxID=1077935 RepID=A0A2H5F684_9RHOB|nr:glycosyltransferase family 4 protein [Paracoccus zhejiangensis]AUH67044.1 hypothetical protein CX676_22315 [Paracoccus zhejiangensis]